MRGGARVFALLIGGAKYLATAAQAPNFFFFFFWGGGGGGGGTPTHFFFRLQKMFKNKFHNRVGVCIIMAMNDRWADKQKYI